MTVMMTRHAIFSALLLAPACSGFVIAPRTAARPGTFSRSLASPARPARFSRTARPAPSPTDASPGEGANGVIVEWDVVVFRDGDGLSNAWDGCPDDGSGYTDTDADGACDESDTDDDDDGTLDADDAFPLDASEDTDTDGDGIADFLNAIVPGEAQLLEFPVVVEP